MEEHLSSRDFEYGGGARSRGLDIDPRGSYGLAVDGKSI
jgi:hypothetical protein